MFNFNELKPLLNFGSKLFASKLIDTIYSKLDILIIGKLFSALTLGFYYRAVSLNQLVANYTSGALQGVFFPVISHLQNDKCSQIKIVNKSLHLVSFTVFMLLGLLYLNSKEIIILLFTEKWIQSVEYLEIMVLYGYAYPISVILVGVISGNGESKMFLHLEILKKVFAFTSMLIGFYFGIKGFLWGTVVSVFIGVLINMWFVQKLIKWNILNQVKILFTYVLPCIVPIIILNYSMVFLTFGFFTSLIIKSFTFLVLYLLLNYFLKSLGFVLVRTNLIKVLNVYL